LPSAESPPRLVENTVNGPLWHFGNRAEFAIRKKHVKTMQQSEIA
jgi:hypothetical protein